MVGALVLALLLIGVYNNALIVFLTAGWRQGLNAVGLGHSTQALQQGLGNKLSARFLPAAATYTALYLFICLLLLRVLLLTSAQWRTTLRLYAGAIGLFVGLVLVSKLAGGAPWAYRVSRDFLDFLVSPVPVAGLYVLFRAGFQPPPIVE